MAKRKEPVDIRLPIPVDASLSNPPTTLEPKLEKQILQLALKASYEISDYNAEYDSGFSKPYQLFSDDRINMVTSLMQSLQPTNSVEAALAIQFAATYIQGAKYLQHGHVKLAMPLLAFSQTTLDSLNRYRNKGMQQINVQYNVNKGQVVNIKSEKTEGH